MVTKARNNAGSSSSSNNSRSGDGGVKFRIQKKKKKKKRKRNDNDHIASDYSDSDSDDNDNSNDDDNDKDIDCNENRNNEGKRDSTIKGKKKEEEEGEKQQQHFGSTANAKTVFDVTKATNKILAEIEKARVYLCEMFDPNDNIDDHLKHACNEIKNIEDLSEIGHDVRDFIFWLLVMIKLDCRYECMYNRKKKNSNKSGLRKFGTKTRGFAFQYVYKDHEHDSCNAINKASHQETWFSKDVLQSSEHDILFGIAKNIKIMVNNAFGKNRWDIDLNIMTIVALFKFAKIWDNREEGEGIAKHADTEVFKNSSGEGFEGLALGLTAIQTCNTQTDRGGVRLYDVNCEHRAACGCAHENFTNDTFTSSCIPYGRMHESIEQKTRGMFTLVFFLKCDNTDSQSDVKSFREMLNNLDPTDLEFTRNDFLKPQEVESRLPEGITNNNNNDNPDALANGTAIKHTENNGTNHEITATPVSVSVPAGIVAVSSCSIHNVPVPTTATATATATVTATATATVTATATATATAKAKAKLPPTLLPTLLEVEDEEEVKESPPLTDTNGGGDGNILLLSSSSSSTKQAVVSNEEPMDNGILSEGQEEQQQNKKRKICIPSLVSASSLSQSSSLQSSENASSGSNPNDGLGQPSHTSEGDDDNNGVRADSRRIHEKRTTAVPDGGNQNHQNRPAESNDDDNEEMKNYNVADGADDDVGVEMERGNDDEEEKEEENVPLEIDNNNNNNDTNNFLTERSQSHEFNPVNSIKSPSTKHLEEENNRKGRHLADRTAVNDDNKHDSICVNKNNNNINNNNESRSGKTRGGSTSTVTTSKKKKVSKSKKRKLRKARTNLYQSSAKERHNSTLTEIGRNKQVDGNKINNNGNKRKDPPPLNRGTVKNLMANSTSTTSEFSAASMKNASPSNSHNGHGDVRNVTSRNKNSSHQRVDSNLVNEASNVATMNSSTGSGAMSHLDYANGRTPVHGGTSNDEDEFGFTVDDFEEDQFEKDQANAKPAAIVTARNASATDPVSMRTHPPELSTTFVPNNSYNNNLVPSTNNSDQEQHSSVDTGDTNQDYSPSSDNKTNSDNDNTNQNQKPTVEQNSVDHPHGNVDSNVDVRDLFMHICKLLMNSKSFGNFAVLRRMKLHSEIHDYEEIAQAFGILTGSMGYEMNDDPDEETLQRIIEFFKKNHAIDARGIVDMIFKIINNTSVRRNDDIIEPLSGFLFLNLIRQYQVVGDLTAQANNSHSFNNLVYAPRKDVQAVYTLNKYTEYDDLDYVTEIILLSTHDGVLAGIKKHNDEYRITINSIGKTISWAELVNFYQRYDCDILFAKLKFIKKENIPRRGGFVSVRLEKEKIMFGGAPKDPDMYTCVPDAWTRLCRHQKITGHDGEEYSYAEAREEIPPCDADGNRELNDMFVLMKKHGMEAVDLKLGGSHQQFFTYTEGLCYFFIVGFWCKADNNNYAKTRRNRHVALFFPKTMLVIDGHPPMKLEEDDRNNQKEIQAMMKAKWGEENTYTIGKVYEIKTL